MVDIFVAKTNSPLTFKHCFNILKEQINEFNFVFTKQGIIIQQINKIKDMYIDLFLEADKFEEYTYNYSKPEIVIGVNVLSIFKILKIITVKDSSLVLRITETELGLSSKLSHDLHLEILNTKRGQMSKTRCDKLDVNRVVFDKFDINSYDLVVDISSQDFQEIINKLKNLGNKNSKEQYVDICYTSGVLSFIIDDKEFGYTEITKEQIQLSNSTESKNKTNDTVNIVSIKLFKLMELMRCTSLTNHVLLYITTGKPLIICYAVGPLGNLYIKIN